MVDEIVVYEDKMYWTRVLLAGAVSIVLGVLSLPLWVDFAILVVCGSPVPIAMYLFIFKIPRGQVSLLKMSYYGVPSYVLVFILIQLTFSAIMV
jgi:hypothetical protein